MNLKLSQLFNENAKLGIHYQHNPPGHFVRCAKCSSVRRVALPADCPPHVLEKKFSRAGWKLSAKNNPVCPACQDKRKIMATHAPIEVKPLVEPAPSVVAVVQPNPKLLRKLISALEQYFDDEKGRYMDGYTDEIIAQDLNIAVPFVEKYRREAFGEIKEDAAVVQMRKEIDVLASDMKTISEMFSTEIKDIESRLADLKVKLEVLKR